MNVQQHLAQLPIRPHLTYQRQYRKCGRAIHCVTCREGEGHGPYWYAYWRENGKLKSGYIGKNAPDLLADQQKEAEA